MRTADVRRQCLQSVRCFSFCSVGSLVIRQRKMKKDYDIKYNYRRQAILRIKVFQGILDSRNVAPY